MKYRQLIITCLGNTLEWLDFGLFIYLAPLIGEKFFPSGNTLSNTLSALSVFAAGFICRPLGGILFGHYGDINGRASTLRISIFMISFSTLLTGLLPTYQSIGITASILFVVLRLIQGISVGGEYGGIMVFLAESATSRNRGLVTSFAAIGANIGFLLATMMLLILTNVVSNDALHQWGWRVPFLVIGCIGTVIFYFRFRLKETATFSYLEKHHHLNKHPLLSALQRIPWQLMKIIGLTCVSSTLYYIFFGYMTSYLSIYQGINQTYALFIQMIFLTVMLFLVPVFGMLGDKTGRKPMLIFLSISVFVLAIPCFWLLQLSTMTSVIMAMSIATVLSSIDQGNTLCAIVENCPSNVRYSSIGFSYNIGNALFGGTAPFMLTALTEKISHYAPAIYLMMMAIITFIAASTLLSKAVIDKMSINNYMV